MGKTPLEFECPFCQVGAGLACKSGEGHQVIGFHTQRYREKLRAEIVAIFSSPGAVRKTQPARASFS